MKLVKRYICDKTPTDKEILECLEIINNENCIIELEWTCGVYERQYRVYLKNGITFEKCKEILIRVVEDFGKPVLD